jgi:hypothetical protein
MNDHYTYTCPCCGEEHTAPVSFAGRQVRCPGCQEVIELPMPPAEVEPEPAAPAPEETRSCPHCNETIKAAALKCWHCGRFLEEGGDLPTAPAAAAQESAPATATRVDTARVRSAQAIAVGGFVLAIVSLMFCLVGLLLAPVALVLGIYSLVVLNRNRVVARRGLAVATIWISIAAILWNLLLFMIVEIN